MGRSMASKAAKGVALIEEVERLKESRDRVVDESLHLIGDLTEARSEAQKWRDAYAAEIDEPPEAMPLPWENETAGK